MMRVTSAAIAENAIELIDNPQTIKNLMFLIKCMIFLLLRFKLNIDAFLILIEVF